MPDGKRFTAALTAHQQRLRMVSIASALVIASAATCLLVVGLSLTRLPFGQVRAMALTGFAVIATLLGMYWWKRWTTARVAAAIESRVPGLDNLVVTADEISRRFGVHRIVRDALFREAVARLDAAPPAAVQPMAASVAVGCAVVAAAFVVLLTGPPLPNAVGVVTRGATGLLDAPPEAGDLRVIITPPDYTERGVTSSVNPSEVAAIEGSRIRLEVDRESGPAQLVEAGRAPAPAAFVPAADRWAYTFTATQSQVLLIQRSDSGGRDGSDRLVHLRVEPDRRPLVRIRAPAKDLIFGEPTGQVAVEIEARDDLALSSVQLNYTRVAGSGETFTFEEGEVPVRIQVSPEGAWHGHATLRLDSLKLADGDTLVYRAIATDRKPGGDPSASDAFLIEIGRLAGVAATGFAVPDERDRQGISQQMLILKTERLHATRSTLSSDALEEQSRLLAMEQRMVKAEFIFMTGGEVADEVEEAEHAHELAEGRFENAAQVELLAAIREMSRAEARLNAADTAQALTFERNALRALQRAFDRRRYLLRVLPERTRIDPARRLTGERTNARSMERTMAEPPPDPTVASARQVLIELGAAIAGREGLNAVLAAKVLTVDPSSEALRKTVVLLTAATDLDARVVAARDAERHLVEIIRVRLAASPRRRISGDPLQGLFADYTARGQK